ncbi:MAG: DUF3530 family protein [Spongiibacteraceae bacterium]|nr:DUF3530 family protein [Spongiibacteraceae bacterium]
MTLNTSPSVSARYWRIALPALLLALTAPALTQEPPATSADEEAPAEPRRPLPGPSVGVRAAEIDEWIPERERIWLGGIPPGGAQSGAAAQEADATGSAPIDEADAPAPASGDPQREPAIPAATPFFARQQLDLSGRPRGSVLIVPDAGQHAAWPGLISALFEQLPLHGWHTLAPALPPPEAVLVSTLPADPAASAPATEPASGTDPEAQSTQTVLPAAGDAADVPASSAEEIAADAPAVAAVLAPTAESIAQQRLQLALGHLRQQGNETGSVAIGIGYGALRAVRLATADPQAFSALALINVDLNPAESAELIDLLAALELPVLDLLTAPAAAQRQAAISRARQLTAHSAYEQVTLPTPAMPTPANEGKHETLTRRVRGWLDRVSPAS